MFGRKTADGCKIITGPGGVLKHKIKTLNGKVILKMSIYVYKNLSLGVSYIIH
jgi:hypothetical protein